MAERNDMPRNEHGSDHRRPAVANHANLRETRRLAGDGGEDASPRFRRAVTGCRSRSGLVEPFVRFALPGESHDEAACGAHRDLYRLAAARLGGVHHHGGVVFEVVPDDRRLVGAVAEEHRIDGHGA